MKKVMMVFGTRPEAIKMCPLVHALRAKDDLQTVVCVTGQHREMLDSVLDTFSVTPDYDLAVMTNRQTLVSLTERVLHRVSEVLEREKPDAVLVHGDTASAFCAALASFYLKIPVCHVEAGLRTYDIRAPFPEELYREAISLMASLHFAPTARARDNLLREGKDARRVFVTGNTAIDALRYTVREDFSHPLLDKARGKRLILLTAHRRESQGEPLREALRAIRRVIEEHEDTLLVYPLHPSPAVRLLACEVLAGHPRISLNEPLDVFAFHNILARAYLVLTDSGGIQEEAPALGKPVLVLRDVTERGEGVAAGTLRLLGTGEMSVYQGFTELLTSSSAYQTMASAVNPYGDGTASRKIADILATQENF